MKVILKTADIDNVYYDNNNFQDYPLNDTSNIIGFCNQWRTKIIYKNINLPSILGSKKFSKNKTFNIKILDIKILNENGNTEGINSQSLALHRTSNIFMYSNRLIPINGAKEILISQLTNFDPNEEFTIFNMSFHRGELADFNHILRGDQIGSREFFNSFIQFENLPFLPFTFYYRNINTTALNNKRVQVNNYSITGGHLVSMLITSIDNDITPRISATITNRSFDMYVVPNQTGWTNRRFTDNIQFDFICEYTYYMPEDYNIDLTFEIRDILTNQLQPIINNINFPSIEIILDIY